MTRLYFGRVLEKNVTLDSPLWLREVGADLFLLSIKYASIGAARFRKFLAASQWYSRQKLEQYQAQRLKILLTYAYKNVPYYRDIFVKNHLTPDDFCSVADLKKLPFLTKEDIHKNCDKLISKKTDKKFLFPVSTSGTTGAATQFYRDKRLEYIYIFSHWRMLRSLGMTENDRHASFMLRAFLSGRRPLTYIYKPTFKQLILTPLPNWDEKIELLKKFKPALLMASPSALYDFAGYLQEHKINDMGLQRIISCYENIFPFQRHFIEKQFRCKVYNLYGSQECAVSAFECSRQDGMHVDMEISCAEIVDDCGEALPDGTKGRIIATPLYQFAMPLIRYDTGDIASISQDSCSCGRGLPLLKSFDGRAGDSIRHKNKFICSSALSPILAKFKNIKECQFIQEKDGEIFVHIVRREGFAERDSKGLIDYLRRLTDEDFKVHLGFVDSIPRTKMGKFQLVISRLKDKGTSGRIEDGQRATGFETCREIF